MKNVRGNNRVHNKPTKKEIVISNQEGPVLTRKQKEFNKLVKKLETIKATHAALSKKLDSNLQYYSEKIFPLERIVATKKVACVKLYYKF